MTIKLRDIKIGELELESLEDLVPKITKANDDASKKTLADILSDQKDPVEETRDITMLTLNDLIGIVRVLLEANDNNLDAELGAISLTTDKDGEVYFICLPEEAFATKNLLPTFLGAVKI